MTKRAIVFPGQGAQSLGMTQDLYEAFASVKKRYDTASAILGYDLAQVVFGDEAKLNQTQYTQPAILTASIAILDLLRAKDLTADIFAGLSLGEYTALVASGALDFETAIGLVDKRGRYMQAAVPPGQGKMVAVLKASLEQIEVACQEASRLGVVTPANYNTPQQIVIGGENEAVDEAVRLLKLAGVKRLVPLKVSGPFHTALLEPASQQLAQALDSVAFSDFEQPVIANLTAKSHDLVSLKASLADQVTHGVKWYQSVNEMIDQGVTEIIEVGPGQVLTGFMRQINPEIKASSIRDLATYKEFLNDN